MGDTKRVKLLVADDDVDLQRALKRVAEAAGYQVLQEFDGLTALATARSTRPDVIVLDIDMPGADGRDVLKRLKGDADTAAIPVLICSARTEQTDRHVGFELGADDYIDKPCAPAQLILRISHMIEKAQHA